MPKIPRDISGRELAKLLKKYKNFSQKEGFFTPYVEHKIQYIYCHCEK